MRHPVSYHLRSARLAEPVALSTVFIVTWAAAPAHAYLDPGIGSMMLQLMLGGVAGAMVVGKLYLRRAQDFFRSFGRRRRAQ